MINFTSRNVICDISSSPALGSGRCGEVLLTTLCRVSVYRNIKQNRREMREGVDDYKFTIIPASQLDVSLLNTNSLVKPLVCSSKNECRETPQTREEQDGR